jgi:hypothetical protein
MGCITAPFKLLGCLGLIIALGLGYVYRDRLEAEGRRIIERIQGIAPSSEGRPGLSSLESATAKVDSLNGWRADSVVLSPSEFASLVGNGMDRELRSRLDSLEVELLDGEIQVSARLHTDRLPGEITGPLGGALRPTESVRAAGPVRVTRPGMGEWSVRSFRIGEFPVPDEMVPDLVGRALGGPSRKSVPVKVPEGIRSIRVRPGAATLYGATPS